MTDWMRRRGLELPKSASAKRSNKPMMLTVAYGARSLSAGVIRRWRPRDSRFQLWGAPSK